MKVCCDNGKPLTEMPDLDKLSCNHDRCISLVEVEEYALTVSDKRTGLSYDNCSKKATNFCKDIDTSYIHAWFEDDAGKAYSEDIIKYQALADVIYKALKPEEVSK